jgi:ankyrin repeat protein
MSKRPIAMRSAIIVLWLAAAVVGCTIYAKQRAASDRSLRSRELFDAIYAGRLDRIRDLVRSGADLNARHGSSTPLYWALWFGSQDAADLLLSLGASTRIDQPDQDGNLLEIACRIALRDKPHRERLLSLVRRLLDEGQDVNYRNHLGVTPLHSASAAGSYEVVRELLSHGARVDAQDYEGDTPLHHAVVQNNVEVAGCLLAHGADPLLSNSAHLTPLALARKKKYTAMAELLRKGSATRLERPTEPEEHKLSHR